MLTETSFLLYNIMAILFVWLDIIICVSVSMENNLFNRPLGNILKDMVDTEFAMFILIQGVFWVKFLNRSC